jgi:hypothetical protein
VFWRYTGRVVRYKGRVVRYKGRVVRYKGRVVRYKGRVVRFVSVGYIVHYFFLMYLVRFNVLLFRE